MLILKTETSNSDKRREDSINNGTSSTLMNTQMNTRVENLTRNSACTLTKYSTLFQNCHLIKSLIFLIIKLVKITTLSSRPKLIEPHNNSSLEMVPRLSGVIRLVRHGAL